MTRIRDEVFDDDSFAALLTELQATADYSLERNKQDHYVRYERAATALRQLLAERQKVA